MIRLFKQSRSLGKLYKAQVYYCVLLSNREVKKMVLAAGIYIFLAASTLTMTILGIFVSFTFGPFKFLFPFP
jgi:hypothetical protein